MRQNRNQEAPVKTLVRTSSKVNAEFIGLDVHWEMTVFSVLNRRGENAAAGEFPTRRKDLSDFLDRTIGRKLSHVVFEASGSTEWIYDEIVSRYGASRVHVAHPKSIRTISRSTQKNDANDSWWLAYMGQEGRLPAAVIPSPAYRELRIAVRHRISLVQTRTRTVTALRSDLTAQGERLPNVKFDTPDNRGALDEIATRWTGVRRLGLTQARSRLADLDGQIAEWDAMIETLAKQFPEVETLEREIPGVGPVLAATICAEAADVRRFSSNNGVVATYTFDASGRRVGKAVSGGVTERYVYADVETIAVYDGSNGWKQDYVFDVTGIDRVLMLEQADVLDQDGDSNTAETTRSYYHGNALGSVMEISTAGQTEAESFRYGPYGEAAITRGGITQLSDLLGQHWSYTSRFKDAEASLYCYRARAYSPMEGRFSQRDPIEYADGSNLYMYVHASPISRSDPTGQRDIIGVDLASEHSERANVNDDESRSGGGEHNTNKQTKNKNVHEEGKTRKANDQAAAAENPNEQGGKAGHGPTSPAAAKNRKEAAMAKAVRRKAARRLLRCLGPVGWIGELVGAEEEWEKANEEPQILIMVLPGGFGGVTIPLGPPAATNTGA